jgi:hypothetical protein
MENKECSRNVVWGVIENMKREQFQQEEKSPKVHEHIDFGSQKDQERYHKEPLYLPNLLVNDLGTYSNR